MRFKKLVFGLQSLEMEVNGFPLLPNDPELVNLFPGNFNLELPPLAVQEAQQALEHLAHEEAALAAVAAHAPGFFCCGSMSFFHALAYFF